MRLPAGPSKASERSPARPRSSPIWSASCSPLERQLRDGNYRPGRYVAFEVNDPKKRIVSAAPFRDRVVHHALCAVVEPIFEARLHRPHVRQPHRQGNASRDRRLRALSRPARLCSALRHLSLFPGDRPRDPEIATSAAASRCQPTLALLDLIVDGSNPQEPVNLYFEGDDLFEPFRRRRGLPIGNLTSQFFANLYLDGFDHFVTEVLRAPYVRYVDDFALFADDPAVLAELAIADRAIPRRSAADASPAQDLHLVMPEPAQFLGFVLHDDGRRRLPEDNVRRFRNRLRGLRDRWRAGASTSKTIDAARRRLDRARRTCRYVALAPCDLPGRPVRSGQSP